MRTSNRSRKIRRHRRVRAKVKGSAKLPRIMVSRSNKYTKVIVVDDETGRVLLSASDMKYEKTEKSGKKSRSFEIGKEIARRAKDAGIKKVVFDRGGYKFHGRVKEVAEGAKKGGLVF